jgi:hypothetical protein
MSIERVLFIAQLCILSLVILTGFIYVLAIVSNKRLYHHFNALTVNLCVAAMTCAVYWLVYMAMFIFSIRQLFALHTCHVVLYMQMMCTCQVPLSVLVVCIHRFCWIVCYSNRFFRTKRWLFGCIIGQWLLGCVLALPMLVRNSWVKSVFIDSLIRFSFLISLAVHRHGFLITKRWSLLSFRHRSVY